jgi:hypothetical protein
VGATLYADAKICVVTMKLLGPRTDILFDMAYISRNKLEKYFVTMKYGTVD